MMVPFNQVFSFVLKEAFESLGSRSSIGSLFHTDVAFEENDDMVELRRHFGGLKRLWEYERVLLSGVQFLQMDENVCGRVLWHMDFLISMAIDW